jgi:ATP-dependent DNA helicase RecG
MMVMDLCSLLKRLLSEGREKSWLEFKLNASAPADIGKYISALSNAALLEGLDNAYLVFGIEDETLRKIGTTFNPATTKKGNDALVNWLSHKLDPPVKAEFHSFICDNLKFVIVEVEPSYFKPVRFEGNAYVRVGSHTKKLADYPELERSLWLATGRRRFENAIASASASETTVLDVLDWKVYYALSHHPSPDNPAEITRRFIQEKYVIDTYDNSFAITNLGALLWAKDISIFPSVSRKTVRVTRYFGIDARNSGQITEGQRGYAVDFEDLVKLICQKTPQREKIVGGVRKTIPIIPEISIREVVANALIHQDLSADGSGPIIEIYDNRIEVSNPGAPLGDVERIIDEAPRSRNELLAHSMRVLGLCEELGKGIDKALTAIEAVAAEDRIFLAPPVFRRTQNGFTVILFGHKTFKGLSREERLRTCYQHCILTYLRSDFMNNSSLRERFSLQKDEYQAVSAVIADAIKSELIVPADEEQGRKHARYIPAWAKA